MGTETEAQHETAKAADRCEPSTSAGSFSFWDHLKSTGKSLTFGQDEAGAALAEPSDLDVLDGQAASNIDEEGTECAGFDLIASLGTMPQDDADEGTCSPRKRP